jgi:hypothetical protein
LVSMDFFPQRYRDASTSANGLNTRLILLCSFGRKPSHQFPASGTAIPIRTVFQAEYRLNDTEHTIERQNHAKPSTVLIPPYLPLRKPLLKDPSQSSLYRLRDRGSPRILFFDGISYSYECLPRIMRDATKICLLSAVPIRCQE